MKLLTTIAILAICLGTGSAQQSLTNDSIIKMAKAGMSDGIIISTIHSEPANFTLSANDLIALKQAGVSDQIMAAMIAKNSPAAASAGPISPAIAATNNYPTDIGVYFRNKGAYTELEPEIVNVKTGGVLKTIATDGIVKGDINGHLKGEHSPNSVFSPAEFLIVVRDGDAPAEYQLLHLRAKSKYREFRSVTGGVFHVSSGASRDSVEFQSSKVAPRTYKITVPASLVPGEYGFLPPGAFSSRNIASSGTIYSFSMVE
jgi:hypothetical protein